MIFQPLADKTNNERLPKPVFKVIRNRSISRGNREMSVVFSGYQILDPVQKRPTEPPAVCMQLFFHLLLLLFRL